MDICFAKNPLYLRQLISALRLVSRESKEARRARVKDKESTLNLRRSLVSLAKVVYLRMNQRHPQSPCRLRAPLRASSSSLARAYAGSGQATQT